MGFPLFVPQSASSTTYKIGKKKQELPSKIGKMGELEPNQGKRKKKALNSGTAALPPPLTNPRGLRGGFG